MTRESGKIRQIQWRKFLTFLTTISAFSWWWLSSFLVAVISSFDVLKLMKMGKKSVDSCWMLTTRCRLPLTVSRLFSCAGSELISIENIFLWNFKLSYVHFHYYQFTFGISEFSSKLKNFNDVNFKSQFSCLHAINITKSSQNSIDCELHFPRRRRERFKVLGSKTTTIFFIIVKLKILRLAISSANYSTFHFSPVIFAHFRAEFISWSRKIFHFHSLPRFRSGWKIMKIITTWRIWIVFPTFTEVSKKI